MNQIRNFSIISHIDHGKSTLADRFLEITGTVSKEKMSAQFLDMMDLEKERGITIKLQPVRMTYYLKPNTYHLNLIDTPGHVDFSYEVSRSLAAVEGTILLVDAQKGIQAQTLANLKIAREQGLVIIPVVNKIDLANASIEETRQDLAQILGISKDKIFTISAKYGTNVQSLLEAVIEKVPLPKNEEKKPLRALVFDSKYDSYKGVIAYVRIMDGEIKKDEKIELIAAKTEAIAKDVGYFQPELSPRNCLAAGEIGYIATGVKEPGKVRVGDTITKLKNKKEKQKVVDIEPLPGYQEPKPKVFASIYPKNADNFAFLEDALNKLKLSDPSLIFEPESKIILGQGFRCGFLGGLHIEIVLERLRREFNLDLIVSSPSVSYKIRYVDPVRNSISNGVDGKEEIIYSPSSWPDLKKMLRVAEIQEPWTKLEIMTPTNHLGNTMKLLETFQAKYKETKYFGSETVLLIYEIPLREIITQFYDKLKTATQGYGSMNYEIFGYKKADLVKLEILIANEKEEVFSKIVPRSFAEQEGRKTVKKLKELLPLQLFSVPLQAVVQGKVIARETIRARAKDVTAPLYGGDYTRKKKLLEKQKKGKKDLKEKGRVNIPQNVFLEMFNR